MHEVKSIIYFWHFVCSRPTKNETYKLGSFSPVQRSVRIDD